MTIVLLNAGSALFAGLAALLWLRSATSKAYPPANPVGVILTDMDSGIEILETLKIQSVWNKRAAVAATMAAIFQAAVFTLQVAQEFPK